MTKTAMTGANKSSVSSGVARGTPPVSTVSLNGSANPSVQLTVHKLNGKNYLEWVQSIKLVINGKRKLGHLNGETTKPADNNPMLKAWRSKNSLVTAWLINSMDPSIGKRYLFLPTARDVWEIVQETYWDLENSASIF